VEPGAACFERLDFTRSGTRGVPLSGSERLLRRMKQGVNLLARGVDPVLRGPKALWLELS
jgi:hypothetical protein